MEGEQFENLLNWSFQSILDTNGDNKIIQEIASEAGKLKSMEEISEYMAKIIEQISSSNKCKAWEMLFSNLALETMGENFEELLKCLEDLKKSDDWFERDVLGDIIKKLPQEIKEANYEKIAEFILDDECTLISSTKLYIVYDLPVKFKEPERYKEIFEMVNRLDSRKESFYPKEIKSKIIFGLPTNFLIENYEEISKEFFVGEEIRYYVMQDFIEKIFNVGPDVDVQKLNEIFSIFKTQIESFEGTIELEKTEIYSAVIKNVPSAFLRGHLEEFLPYADRNEYQRFFEINEVEGIDAERVLENISILTEYLKSKGVYDVIISSEQEKIIKALPESIIKENPIEYYKLVDSHVFQMLTQKVFSNPDKNNYEMLKNCIIWLDENSEEKYGRHTYRKTEVDSLIADLLPADFINENIEMFINSFKQDSFKRLYPKIFEDKENEVDNENLLNKFKIVANYINNNNEYETSKKEEFTEIFKYFPESFFKENPIECFELVNESTYPELALRVFSNPEKENYEKLNECIIWLGKKTEEIFKVITHKKDNLFEDILRVLPTDFIKENLENYLDAASIKNFENVYTRLFESQGNEEYDNEGIQKTITSILKSLENKKEMDYIIKEEHKKLINVIPLEFLNNNIDFCFSKFLKEAYPECVSRIFTFDDNEINDAEIRSRLELVKLKIDENIDYFNVLEESNANECWNVIIKKLPLEFIKNNAGYMLDLLGSKLPDDSKEYFLKTMPNDVIEKYEEKLVAKITHKNVGSYQRYLEYILSNPEKSLITSNIGINILNFINSNLDSNDRDYLKIKELVEKSKSKYERPDMSKYLQYLPQNSYDEKVESMDEKTFEEFIKNIESIKLLDGIIPEKYCDFMIKQKLMKNSALNQNLDKYLPMFKRVFEDKVQHMLLAEGIQGYSIEFFTKQDGTLGVHNKALRSIGFLEDNLVNLDEENTHIINTAFHEVKHAIQSKYYDSRDFSKLDGAMYNMIKEEIIREDDLGFYKRNYTRMYCEIDARIAGARGQAEYY